MTPTSSTLRAPLTASAAVTALLVLTACGTQAIAEPAAEPAVPTDRSHEIMRTVLHDADGNEIGTARFIDRNGRTRVTITVHGLTPGYHGLHVHAIGRCEPDSPSPTDPTVIGDFLSAGGHFALDPASHHGAHTGDLPSLYVDQDGLGSLGLRTDAFTTGKLLDGDGSAVMIHAGRDNFANIPTRYAPEGPDADTLKTGDAGTRIACGAITT